MLLLADLCGISSSWSGAETWWLLVVVLVVVCWWIRVVGHGIIANCRWFGGLDEIVVLIWSSSERKNGRESRMISQKKRENPNGKGCGLLEVEEWRTKGGLVVFQQQVLSEKGENGLSSSWWLPREKSGRVKNYGFYLFKLCLPMSKIYYPHLSFLPNYFLNRKLLDNGPSHALMIEVQKLMSVKRYLYMQIVS